jgi:hypothetical protein
MKINPLLSNEISVSEQLDEAHNENYSKELKILYDEIIADLQKETSPQIRFCLFCMNFCIFCNHIVISI